MLLLLLACDDIPTNPKDTGSLTIACDPVAETCNGRDDDCDGSVDEDVFAPTAWWVDADGDGHYGLNPVYSCEAPEGAHDTDEGADDCDDADSAVHPDADERCNGEDDDCDGTIDEDGIDGPEAWPDTDGDGYGAGTPTTACETPGGHVTDDTDCDDTLPDVHPDAEERCNERDDDCDGSIDEDAVDAPVWYVDTDGDGYAGDNALASCTQPTGATATVEDCDDTSYAVHPGADERCNGVDDDCDGTIDEEGVDGAASWPDTDGDGFGAGTPVYTCTTPAGHVADDTDCDDAAAEVYPGATETCNERDDDCDGDIDEDAVGGPSWYVDTDGDGWAGDSTVSACTQPDGSSATVDDCDDADSAVYPGADEWCNGVDDDCDGTIDEEGIDGDPYWPDTDGDGFGAGVPTYACTQPGDHAASDDDCDDTEDRVYPGAREVCESGLDEDCDGVDDRCALEGNITTGEADLYLSGTTNSEQTGAAAVWLGDTDGDGVGEFAVSTIYDGSGAGALVIVPADGSVTETEDAPTWIDGSDASSHFGHAMAAGDLDGDGESELVVGHPDRDLGPSDETGAAWIYAGPFPTGRFDHDAVHTMVVWPEDNGDELGTDVAVLGDLDGDGSGELVIGAAGRSGDNGAVYLEPGPIVGSGDTRDAGAMDVRIDGGTDERLGAVVADAGDADGDGVPELAFGGARGELYVLSDPFGAGSVLAAADSTWVYTSSADWGVATQGTPLDGGADIDGDGYDDLLAGDEAGGAVMILPGGLAVGSQDLDAVGHVLTGSYGFGASVDGGGDVDGDGFADVLVGGPSLDGTDASAAWLVYGVAGFPTGVDATFTAGGVDEHVGTAVCVDGDADGDGRQDVIVGATGYDGVDSTSGAVWLFLGGPR